MIRETILPLMRYGIVGLVSNTLLFLIYLVLEALGAAPELAATIAFALGCAWTYIANRNWSFASDTAHGFAAPRYVLTYAMGYVFTIGTLFLTHRVFGWPHYVGQLCAILIAAVAIFLLLKVWVFQDKLESIEVVSEEKRPSARP
ncbi:MAG: GtrA family protein [Pseudomonadota bacterium]